MEDIETSDLLKQIGITTLIVFSVTTIVILFGQPILNIVENTIGTEAYIVVLTISFIWFGYEYITRTDYFVSTTIIASSIVYTFWPNLIELILGVPSSQVFALGGFMWVGYTIGSIIPTVQSRLTSGER